jgi:prolyl 4-hydroxylase
MSESVVLEHAEQVTGVSAESRLKDLVAWAVDRHAESHCPAQIFNGMRSSEWSTGDAVAALLQALPRELHEQVRELPRGAPDPDLSTSPSTITIDGHTVQVLCDMRNPRLVVFGNLLSPQECEELMAAATARLERSMVVGDGTDSDVSDVRTSWGMFFGRDETPLCTRLDARIAALLDWPVSHAEEMQVLRYGKAQQYEPHHDYFEPSEGNWASVFRRGGQRVGSMVIYLNTPPLGGSTVFPDIPMEVRAVAGNAVFFAYETPDASSRTLHGGAPVGDGEKWVAVKWFRQGPFA